MVLLDVLTFLGRLHPLAVHLPIGFLLLAAGFDLLSYTEKYKQLKPTVALILFAGFVTATIACIVGYLLSWTGEYDNNTLNNHKVAGIILTILSGLLYLLTTKKVQKYFRLGPTIFSLSLLAIITQMIYTGHQGSKLTHGNEYLTLKTLTEAKRKTPVRVDEAMIFEDVIHPMLEKRCASCHREDKMKGKLSVEQWSDLMKGGKSGPAIIAGNLQQSELFRRITLDPDHKEYMPKDGKTPLTKNETEIIRWWIEKGMAVKEKKLAEIKDYESIKPKVASFLKLPGHDGNQETSFNVTQNINSEIPRVLDPLRIENLRKKGFMVRILLHKPVMLDVTIPAGGTVKISEVKEEIKSVAGNVIWLNVSSNNLTENDLDFLPLLVNVEKLRLEKNPIADGIGDLVINLKHLESLNLNETKISQTCFNKLKKKSTLKRIYAWKTEVKQ